MSVDWEPRPYQLEGAKFVVGRPAAGLFFYPGMGKTSTMLAACTAFRKHNIGTILVVCPLRPAYKVWPVEVKKWKQFSHLKVVVLHGPHKADRLRESADIYVINPEGLDWLWRQALIPFDILIVDESTKFKNGTTKRFVELRKHLNLFKRRYILTGTPQPNSLMDLWAQLYILDGGDRLGRFISHYRRQYFTEKRYANFSEWVPRIDAQSEVVALISDVCMTLTPDGHLDLPEMVVNDIVVPLPTDARKFYFDMHHRLVAELRESTVSASTAAVKVMKLRQLASGAVYRVDSRAMEAEQVHTAKLEALEELLEEQCGEPLMVAVAFQHEARAISNHWRYPVPYLGGGVSAKDGAKIQDDWNAGKIPLLVVHPTSVAHGLNLQHGGHALCWYSLTWNAEEYDQLNARLHRQGQKNTVVIHRLIAEDTVDEQLVSVLSGKNRDQSALLEALRRS